MALGFGLVALGLLQRQLDLFSHCVLMNVVRRPLNVFEKNYRLQDIQLSKIPGESIVPICQIASRRYTGLPDTGGEYRARTGDLLVANQALSQLS